MDGQPHALPIQKKVLTVTLMTFSVALFISWLLFTPPGVEGKVRAAGYSVCHQIDSHTLTIGNKLLPLCARCTGTFLGVLTTVLFLRSREKRGGIPSKPVLALLVLFLLMFTVDGVNSTLTVFPGIKPLYQPSNTLRLATGLLFGTTLGTLVLTLWAQTLWSVTSQKPIIKNWRQFLLLMLIEIVIGGLILVDIPILFFPIAILSIGAIFFILTMVYSLLWSIILKKENSLTTFKDGFRIYIAGIITAILQVGLMDLLRFWLTGSWQGFHL